MGERGERERERSKGGRNSEGRREEWIDIKPATQTCDRENVKEENKRTETVIPTKKATNNNQPKILIANKNKHIKPKRRLSVSTIA